jgi:nicotinic acid phosphoribosyltransferase
MSLLKTDGYKFSMAEAGWPLRRETFYYAHRKGGPALVPFDVNKEIRKLLPRPSPADYAYLIENEYEMSAGFKAAIAAPEALTVHALPKGSWFFPREPLFSVTGPSALASWIEPLALTLHFRIQVATLAHNDPSALEVEIGTVTCEEERDIVLETLSDLGVPAPRIVVASEAYADRVQAAARELIAIVRDPGRIFEVGLRAATCVSQHLIALEACKALGITRTSHVWGARALGMVPVGTMGHEHVQRFGSDEAAFRAMRDRRPGRSSYLLDTFDTIHSGIPAAYRLMEEDPRRGDSIRYDSGDKVAQYRYAAAEARRRGLRPVQILEDGFDAALTKTFEALREEVGWAPDEQFYGYGGTLVAKTSCTRLVRDRVAAVYKLSQTATTPTMKFADEPGGGKESIPGRPVVFRRKKGGGASAGAPVGIVGQMGEPPPPGYEQLTDGAPVDTDTGGGEEIALSQATQAIAAVLRARRGEQAGESRHRHTEPTTRENP